MLRQTILVALLLAGCGGRDDAPAPSAERELPVQPRNVLVIVLDTVRDDRIGVRGITPNLDAFTAGAIEFENAYSNSGWTAANWLLGNLFKVALASMPIVPSLSSDSARASMSFTSSVRVIWAICCLSYLFDLERRFSIEEKIQGINRK